VALPHGLGSPDVFGNRSPVIFGNGIVQSVASRVDGLFSGTAVAAVSVWQAMSFASQAESLTLKLLSLSGRFIKSTKGNLVTAGLWT
jgi:NADPH-dependent curcumin reductase CurA